MLHAMPAVSATVSGLRRAEPVGQPAGQRGQRRLGQRRAQECGRDDRARQPSRESRSGARTSITPKAMPARAISHMPITTWRSRSAGSAARRRCGASGRGAGTVNAIAIRRRCGDRGGRERGPRAHGARHRAHHRPEQRADHRRPEGVTEQLPAPLSRRGRREPGQRRGPGARAGDALHEPRRVKHGGGGQSSRTPASTGPSGPARAAPPSGHRTWRPALRWAATRSASLPGKPPIRTPAPALDSPAAAA